MENLLELIAADDAHYLVVISLVFLLAGAVKGVIGLGLPTVAVGLLGLIMTPMDAAALLILPSLATNLWQALAGRDTRALLRRLWPLLAGTAAGTLAGTAFTANVAVHGAELTLGFALILYAALGLSALQFSVPVRAEPWLSPLAGTGTGLITVVTGVFVIPSVPYLQALQLDKEDLVQAMGLAFVVSTLTLAASLTFSGKFHLEVAGTSLLALLPALGGMMFGQWIRARVRPAVFRRCFFFGLLALGLHLAARSLF
jgi:uncharacterized membrane protein YfcA